MAHRTDHNAMSSTVTSIHQSLSIPANYTVHFTDNALAPDNALLAQAIQREGDETTSLLCFVDSEVLRLHPDLAGQLNAYLARYPAIRLSTTPLAVPGGEACKNDPEALQEIYRLIIEYNIDRHSCVLAIGGGAVLDFIGYAGATAHRGIRLIRMPTTVLSQNDSGVGVKNGINFMHRKNFLGTFSAPDAVICDFRFLQTLQPRDKRAGLAEAVKVGLIRDGAFFHWLEEQASELAAFEAKALHQSIIRCAEIHARQISSGGDPFEKGSSRPLDYGHWLAHKLEDMSDYELRHGEAVAIGLLVDARYSVESGLLSEADLMRINELLKRLGFALWHPSLKQKDGNGQWVVLDGLEEFREHLGGELSITLLQAIGVGLEVHDIDHDMMIRCLEWVESFHAR